MTHANLLLLEYLCFILFGWIQVKLLNLKFQKLFIFDFLIDIPEVSYNETGLSIHIPILDTKARPVLLS